MRRRPSTRAQMLIRELETHEHVTTYMTPDSTSPLPPPLPPPDPLLSLFYSTIPQELRDTILTYLLTPPPVPQPFILYPPFLFPSLPSPPYNLLPYSPLRFPIPSPPSPSPLFTRLTTDLTSLITPFFAQTPIYTRYRYTPSLPFFLSTPFEGSSCIPIQHVRTLHIFLAPPESCEDDWGLDDGEGECGWGELFGVGNERWVMWRGRMEGDFRELGGVLKGMGGDCKVTVWVLEVYDDGKGEGVVKWVEGWAEGVNRGGGRVGVRVYKG